MDGIEPAFIWSLLTLATIDPNFCVISSILISDSKLDNFTDMCWSKNSMMSACHISRKRGVKDERRQRHNV